MSHRTRFARGAVPAEIAILPMTAVLLAAVSATHVAAPRRELDLALQTSAGIFAGIGACLVATRVRRRRRLDDVLVALALSLLAVTALVLGAVPEILAARGPSPFVTDAALTGDAIAALLLAVAAFGSAPTVSGRAARAATALPAAFLVSSAVVVLAESPHDAAGAPAMTDVAHASAAAFESVTALLFVAAATGFARAFRRKRDEFMAWLVPAAMLAALARADDLLHLPGVSRGCTGDVLRLLSVATVAIGGARDVHLRWRADVAAAVCEERRRVARDVHDVLAQEIAYLARNLKHLDAGDDVVRRLEAGAGRALVESRQAISALTAPLGVPLDVDLGKAAAAAATREGTELELALAAEVHVTPAQHDALVRIASEAITNAARHGGAERVRVEMDGGAVVRLRVMDTGTGFDPHVWRGDGFGLVSMRERAQAIGARFRLITTPGEGTEVEVTLAPEPNHGRHR